MMTSQLPGLFLALSTVACVSAQECEQGFVYHSTLPGIGFVVSGDFDRDGFVDLVIGATIWLGRPSLEFTAGGTLTHPVGREDVVVDITGDGVLDIVGGEIETRVHVGDGSGGFEPHAISSSRFAGVADVDGDGWLDIGTWNTIFTNSGNGTFKSRGITGLGSHRLRTFFDQDGDGAAEGFAFDGSRCSIVRLVAGSFTAEFWWDRCPSDDMSFQYARAMDFNDDGLGDLLVHYQNSDWFAGHGYSSDRISVWLSAAASGGECIGFGACSVTSETCNMDDSMPWCDCEYATILGVADMDGDGRLDAMGEKWDDDCQSVFTVALAGSCTTWSFSEFDTVRAAQDVNGDGAGDLFISTGAGTLDLYINACLGIPGDTTGDGVVDIADLLDVLSNWGPCGSDCPQDLDRDGVVGVGDLLIVLANWS